MKIHPAFKQKTGESFNIHYDSQANAYDAAACSELMAMTARRNSGLKIREEWEQADSARQMAALAQTYHIALG